MRPETARPSTPGAYAGSRRHSADFGPVGATAYPTFSATVDLEGSAKIVMNVMSSNSIAARPWLKMLVTSAQWLFTEPGGP